MSEGGGDVTCQLALAVCVSGPRKQCTCCGSYACSVADLGSADRWIVVHCLAMAPDAVHVTWLHAKLLQSRQC